MRRQCSASAQPLGSHSGVHGGVRRASAVSQRGRGACARLTRPFVARTPLRADTAWVDEWTASAIGGEVWTALQAGLVFLLTDRAQLAGAHLQDGVAVSSTPALLSLIHI